MNGDERGPITNYAVISHGQVAGDKIELLTQDHGEANAKAESVAIALHGRDAVTCIYQQIASYIAETKVVMKKVGE